MNVEKVKNILDRQIELLVQASENAEPEHLPRNIEVLMSLIEYRLSFDRKLNL